MRVFINTLLQFAKFSIIGLSNVCISLAVYYVLLNIGLYYLYANLFGFFISIMNSFIWNSKFVFKSSTNPKRTAIKFFLNSIFFFMFGSFLLFIFIDYLHVNENVAPILNLFITTPMNFLLNKFIVFKPILFKEKK